MNTKTIQDHLGRTLTYSFPPQRIISLCPSQTETVFSLGLDKQIVGVTNYCIHPADKIATIQKIGGTKKINYSLIETLHPDLVIAEKEENTIEIVDKLSQKYPVYVTNVENYDGALKMITDLGILTNTETQANQLVENIKQRFLNLIPANNIKVAYFIWRKPFMVAGSNTFIHSILQRAGFHNVFENYEGRYPKITSENIANCGADYVFLSSEPYPFTEKHIAEIRNFLPTATVILVNGEMFSWYGSRMLFSVDYLNKLIEKMSNFATI